MKLIEKNIIKCPDTIQSTQICDKYFTLLQFDFDFNQSIHKGEPIEFITIDDRGSGFRVRVRTIKPIGEYDNEDLFLYSVLYYDTYEELTNDGWDI